MKTRTLLSTGGRPRPSTKSLQLICGDQRQGKWGVLSSVIGKICRGVIFSGFHKTWLLLLTKNIGAGVGGVCLKKDSPACGPALSRHRSSCSCWAGLPGASSLPRPLQLPEQTGSR